MARRSCSVAPTISLCSTGDWGYSLSLIQDDKVLNQIYIFDIDQVDIKEVSIKDLLRQWNLNPCLPLIQPSLREATRKQCTAASSDSVLLVFHK